MRRKKRKERAARGYTEAQRAEMWERWGRGESLKAIGRIFGKEGGSVFGSLRPMAAFALGHAAAHRWH